MKILYTFKVFKRVRLLLCVLLSLPAIAACSSTESANCTRLVFQPYGAAALSNPLPVCPGTRVYSYDPQLFEHQATWVESYTDSEESDKDKKKGSS